MRSAIISLYALAYAAAAAQTGARDLGFEAASVKRAAPDDGSGMTRVQGGLGTSDPGQVVYRNISLKNLLGRAYPESYRTTGPAWLDEERYDVIAKIPMGTDEAQFKQMLRNLLADRFGLKIHHEAKDFAAYNLMVAKGGPKFDAAPNGTREGFPKLERAGMIVANSISVSGYPIARLTAKEQPIPNFVVLLSHVLGQPVRDKTGLTGIYDFTLEYGPPAPADTDTDAPGIDYAIHTLGLTLEKARITLDVLVVDQAVKIPAAN